MSYRTVGVIFHPHGTAARHLVATLKESCLHDVSEVWAAQTGDESELSKLIDRTDLLVCDMDEALRPHR